LSDRPAALAGDAGDLGREHIDALRGIEHGPLRRVADDGDDEPVEQRRRTRDHVDMSQGDRVETARIDRRAAHVALPPGSARLRARWSSVEP
jgi:hypothetical protein